MTYQEFKNNYLGKKIDVDQAFFNQCYDLPVQYWHDVYGHYLNVPYDWPVCWWTGGVIDFFEHFNEMFDKSIFQLIPNNPSDYNQVPREGDVIVFGKHPGNEYGHVSIFDRSTGPNQFVSLDQNYMGRLDPVREVNHVYTGDSLYGPVLGWIRVIKSAHEVKQQAMNNELQNEINQLQNKLKQAQEAAAFAEGQFKYRLDSSLKIQNINKDTYLGDHPDLFRAVNNNDLVYILEEAKKSQDKDATITKLTEQLQLKDKYTAQLEKEKELVALKAAEINSSTKSAFESKKWLTENLSSIISALIIILPTLTWDPSLGVGVNLARILGSAAIALGIKVGSTGYVQAQAKVDEASIKNI
jgi:hypothetical protein